jgi:NADH-quinone oxidoreductase subunit C
VKTCEDLKEKGFDYLKKITAVDYTDHLDVVYLLYNTKTNQDEIIKVRVPAANPQVDTIIDIYKAADWYERELFEMFGIGIKGREVKRLLLELWNGVDPPLRKSFIWGKDYKKMS